MSSFRAFQGSQLIKQNIYSFFIKFKYSHNERIPKFNTIIKSLEYKAITIIPQKLI